LYIVEFTDIAKCTPTTIYNYSYTFFKALFA